MGFFCFLKLCSYFFSTTLLNKVLKQEMYQRGVQQSDNKENPLDNSIKGNGQGNFQIQTLDIKATWLSAIKSDI